MIKSVNYQFRILYALAIIFVVAGHCGNGGISFFYDWFTPYAFHLGIFAFGSGFFYKMEEADNLLIYIYKKVKSLLIPLFLCNFLYGIIVFLLREADFKLGGYLTLYNLFIAPITRGDQFTYNLATWFVFPLFMVLVINNTLFRILKNVKVNKFIFVFIFYTILGLVSVHLARNGYNKGVFLIIDRIFFLMPMFAAGILYKEYKLFDNISNLKYFSVLFIIQLIMIQINGGLKGNDICWMRNLMPGLKPFIVEFVGIFFWVRVSKLLEPILKDSTVINYIGKNTFSIMTHHLMAFMFVKYIFKIISELTPYFSDFNTALYKSKIYYLYIPEKINQYKIIYLVAGIVIPLLLSLCYDIIKKRLKKQHVQLSNNQVNM